MPRRSNEEISTALETVLTFGDGAPSQRAKLRSMQMLRSSSAEVSQMVDDTLLEHLARSYQRAEKLLEEQAKLRAAVEKLRAAPWYPARLLKCITALGQLRAHVQAAGGTRVVDFGEGVDAEALGVGDLLYLNADQNLVMAKADADLGACGETASYERRLPDGRLIAKVRDEELVLTPAAMLDVAALEPGDQLRFDHSTWLALERTAREPGRHLLLERVDDIARDAIGGLGSLVDKVLTLITLPLRDPATALLYKIDARRGILFEGPSGTGKTLLARVMAAELQRVTGRRAAFAIVKPGEFESPWVGETERKIRETFAALAVAAEDGVALLFLDEVESIGRTRGEYGGGTRIADQLLAALLAELDGFHGRGNIIVVAATNRADLLDPAIRRRLGHSVVVARPDRAAAREIFDIHLGEDLPFAANGVPGGECRERMIETSLSSLYAPNGDNALCTLVLRDGERRTVRAADLMSGARIEQICTAARQSALQRHLDGNPTGIVDDDLAAAVADAIEELARTIAPRNAHAYLSDLPGDVDVVRVEPVRRRVRRAYRYLRAAA